MTEKIDVIQYNKRFTNEKEQLIRLNSIVHTMTMLQYTSYMFQSLPFYMLLETFSYLFYRPKAPKHKYRIAQQIYYTLDTYVSMGMRWVNGCCDARFSYRISYI